MRYAYDREAAEADRFLADLLGEPVPARSRVRRRRRPVYGARESEELSEIVEVSGFFGPNNVRLTERQVRDAVVARANAEWATWHNAAGHAVPEGDAAMFGRLVGYYVSTASRLMPDTLTAVQTAALGANYARLLAAGQTAAAIATEARRIAPTLLAGTPDAALGTAATHVSNGIIRAREAHTNRGDFSAWSAAFVTACVRGTAISEGLEAVIASGPTGRDQVGRDVLLEGSTTHAAYTIAARRRRAATTPRQRGTYHAFTARERQPQLADIIVLDRTANTIGQVATVANLAAGRLMHGDIVVEIQPGFVVTIGGNVGDSVRRRRYPLDQQGLLVVDRRQLFTQEDNAGALAAVPVQTAQALAILSTGRVFGLLSPVEEQAAVPGQPYHGGILT